MLQLNVSKSSYLLASSRVASRGRYRTVSLSFHQMAKKQSFLSISIYTNFRSVGSSHDHKYKVGRSVGLSTKICKNVIISISSGRSHSHISSGPSSVRLLKCGVTTTRVSTDKSGFSFLFWDYRTW